jgi:hypothetical protein
MFYHRIDHYILKLCIETVENRVGAVLEGGVLESWVTDLEGRSVIKVSKVTKIKWNVITALNMAHLFVQKYRYFPL